jgi:hypothetical protein
MGEKTYPPVTDLKRDCNHAPNGAPHLSRRFVGDYFSLHLFPKLLRLKKLTAFGGLGGNPAMSSTTLPAHANVAVIEAAYEAWSRDPNSVDPTWRAFFQGFTLASNGGSPAGRRVPRPTVATRRAQRRPSSTASGSRGFTSLINAYRSIGHLEADINPLASAPAVHPKLSLQAHGLDEADLDTTFDVGTYLGGGQMKLADVVATLRSTYCTHVGVEYTHIQDVDVRTWLQDKMERSRNLPTFSKAEKVRILRRVHKAELFERFLHTKYVGQKRFSLEGGETMIAAVDSIIEHCPARWHRGGRHGNGPPRPAQYPHERDAEKLRCPLRAVLGKLHSRDRRRRRRREVPPRLRSGARHCRRQEGRGPPRR